MRGLLEDVEVLAVHDDPATMLRIRSSLEHAGARVYAATSVDEARDSLRHKLPDVLICDLSARDSCDFVGQLRRERDPRLHRVPALALVASEAERDDEQARAAGFQRCAGLRELAPFLDAIRRLAALSHAHRWALGLYDRDSNQVAIPDA